MAEAVTRRPRLLDLFCGAGGCSVGYHRAGFDVVGVDCKPQPNYPFEFVQADWLDYLARNWRRFDAIHASPPCQAYSKLMATRPSHRNNHPDLVAFVRRELVASGQPWVIENVYGAPLGRGAVMLCGAMFGLRTYRHRYFECSFPLLGLSHPKHKTKSCKGTRRKEYFLAGGFISVVGNVGTYCGPAAMGIDWMIGRELSQAIPPAYTEFVGRQLLTLLTETANG